MRFCVRFIFAEGFSGSAELNYEDLIGYQKRKFAKIGGKQGEKNLAELPNYNVRKGQTTDT